MILIVDDKPENIFSLKSVLELNNFDVDTAGSGEEALKKILKNTYTLIILDVQMPGMDGFEVAEALSGYSKVRDIPIIFLSAVNTDKKFITKGYTSGAVDYITKPADPEVLLLKVKNFNRLSEQTQQLRDIQQSLREEIEVRKQAEAALDIKIQELHSVLECMPQLAFTATPEGEMEFVNAQWYEYALNKNSFPRMHPDDKQIVDTWKTRLSAGELFVTEVRIRKLNSSEYRHHLLRIIPVKQQEKTIKWVGTFTDIHQQKLTNEMLEQRVKERTTALKLINEELEASNHELQQFAFVASHDLKEPLRKIQIFSSMIRDKYLHEADDTAESLLNRIISSSDRMHNLINDLLAYSRLSIDTLFHPTDLKQVIEDILSDLELPIKEKNAVIRVSELPMIDAVEGQMRQVFQNLFSNALKFSKKDTTPVIDVAAEQFTAAPSGSSSPLQDYVRIIISDNGIGFNQEYAEKIFTIFQRLNAREEYEGTGIGLAITKKIIEKHSGLITASSSENSGAAFTIILPLHQGHGKSQREYDQVIQNHR
ncbi:hybrid sensor histidine kinase/response regulator [Chitinophagaceae bacterium MMS25-I14]